MLETINSSLTTSTRAQRFNKRVASTEIKRPTTAAVTGSVRSLTVETDEFKLDEKRDET